MPISMNQEETLREVKKEKQRVKKLLKESEQKCQELLWAMESENNYGQAKKDSDEAVKIVQTMKCACKVIEG